MFKKLKFVLVLGGILVLTGCATTKEEVRPSDDQLTKRIEEEMKRVKEEEMSPALENSIDELVQQISKDMTAQKKTTIAVIDFTDLSGNVSNFGRYLSEELITRLFKTGKFKVIERNLLNKVIEEQKLTLTQIIDPASAKQLGRILGVDAIVSGTIGDLLDKLKVNARIIGTEKGDVFAVASTTINKNEAVIKLMSEGVRKASVTPEENGAPSIPPASKKPLQTLETENFLFALKECKMQAGGAVICDFSVTNKSEKDLVGISVCSGVTPWMGSYQPCSHLYDDLGNKYGASSGGIERELAPQTPTRFTLRFEGVSSEAKTAVILIVKTREGNLTFRNIPLVK